MTTTQMTDAQRLAGLKLSRAVSLDLSGDVDSSDSYPAELVPSLADAEAALIEFDRRRVTKLAVSEDGEEIAVVVFTRAQARKGEARRDVYVAEIDGCTYEVLA